MEESGSQLAGLVPMVLNLIHLGRIDYAAALGMQQQLVQERHAQRIGNTLLLLEHPPVLTLGRNSGGRNSSYPNILASEEQLASRGVQVHEINRGGDVTYHGPGQLVGYPILDLRSFNPRLGAVEYVRLLEEALIRACADFGVMAQRIAGRTGVWTIPGGEVPEKKIAAIGVHIARGITSHGFALNVTTDLRDFDLIVPCGISDRTVTSLEAEAGFEPNGDSPLQPAPTMDNAIHATAKQFGRVFGTQVLWLESLADLGVEGLCTERVSFSQSQ